MIAYTLYSYDARVRREARALAAHAEYTVSLFVLKERKQRRTYLIDGVTVEELNIPKYRGESRFSYLISYLHFLILATLICTAKFIRQEIDTLHIHNMPNFLVFAGIIPRLFGKKMILDIHDSTPESYFGKYEKASSKLLYKILCLEERISCVLAHKIICVNQIQCNALVERGIPAEKIAVVMNVPDDKNFFQNRITRTRAGNETFRMVYHGTVAKRLGVHVAIRAVAKLGHEIPGLQFHIFGLGQHVELENLARLSKALGVENRVFLEDSVSVEQIPEVLKTMDLGVVPNCKNRATVLMLPVKLMEYVAVGIPVVAARLKTIQYYFSDDMLAYFEPDSVDSLANAIRDLYLNETKSIRQSKNALTFIEKYGWETHKLELLHLYKNLLQSDEEGETPSLHQKVMENAQC